MHLNRYVTNFYNRIQDEQKLIPRGAKNKRNDINYAIEQTCARKIRGFA